MPGCSVLVRIQVRIRDCHSLGPSSRIQHLCLHGVLRRASQAFVAAVGAVLPKNPMVFWCWNVVVQLSGALQPFMASRQGLAQMSPVLGLVLARETSPDPAKSIRLNKKLWDLMSFQFIRNTKALFLVQKRVSKNGFPCESQSFAPCQPRLGLCM